MDTLLMESFEIPDAIDKAIECSREKGGLTVRVELKGGVTAEVRENSNRSLVLQYYDWLIAGCFGKRKNIGPNPNPTIEEKMKERLARIEEKKMRREEERARIEKAHKESKRKKKPSRRFCI